MRTISSQTNPGSPAEQGLAAIDDHDPATRELMRSWLERQQELARQAERVLGSEVAVCISGESGTGRELVAHAIHASGPRRRGPFVAINCAAIPDSLQESELVGHERGAFAGAKQIHRGRLEQATGGTLFLDEVGKMSPAAQAALLRTLRGKAIRRVGGSVEIPVDVRVLCAAQPDLKAEVEAGRFLEDLFFRLVVYPIGLPPPDHRRGDGPPPESRINRVAGDAELDGIVPLRELERRAIERALRATRGSVGKAAKLLGIGRATLYRRLATLDQDKGAA